MLDDVVSDASAAVGTAVAAFTYPWDVIGDPAAPARLRDLGADTAVLAAAYHSVTAVTPRHPVHRVVRAPHSAVYYPPDPARWGAAALRPAAQRWCGTADAYGQAARQLRDAGLGVHAWVVVAHNSLLAVAHPEHAVRNAYGDRLSWALCVAQPEVRTELADATLRHRLAAATALQRAVIAAVRAAAGERAVPYRREPRPDGG